MSGERVPQAQGAVLDEIRQLAGRKLPVVREIAWDTWGVVIENG